MPLMQNVDVSQYFNVPYYTYLDTSTKDYGQQQLDAENAAIQQRQAASGSTVGASAPTSKTTYIVIGLAVAALITLGVLKVKKILNLSIYFLLNNSKTYCFQMIPILHYQQQSLRLPLLLYFLQHF